jgi:hypothetical protein
LSQSIKWFHLPLIAFHLSRTSLAFSRKSFVSVCEWDNNGVTTGTVLQRTRLDLEVPGLMCNLLDDLALRVVILAYSSTQIYANYCSYQYSNIIKKNQQADTYNTIQAKLQFVGTLFSMGLSVNNH